MSSTSTLEMYAIVDETPCNQVGLPIPLNLVHFLIRISATKFDLKSPSYLFVGPFLGIRSQPGFSGILLNLTRIANLSRLWKKSSPLLMRCFKCFNFVGQYHWFHSKISDQMTREERSIDIPVVANAFNNGFSADGPVVEVLRIVTKLSDG